MQLLINPGLQKKVFVHTMCHHLSVIDGLRFTLVGAGNVCGGVGLGLLIYSSACEKGGVGYRGGREHAARGLLGDRVVYQAPLRQKGGVLQGECRGESGLHVSKYTHVISPTSLTMMTPSFTSLHINILIPASTSPFK